MDIFETLLSSRSKAQIISKLFLQDGREYYMRELERETGVGVRSIHADLYKLESLDLLIQRKDGNRTYFKANEFHPLFSDLKSIVHKLYGPVPILTDILAGQSGIEVAFIFGSYATGDIHAESDIDLFVVGTIGSRKISDLLFNAQKRIIWEINDHFYTPQNLRKKIKEKGSFLSRLKDSPKIFIKGAEDGYRSFYEE